MTKNEPLLIERTANGYIVRTPGDVTCTSDICVFQDLGFATSQRDHQEPEDTLLGFLAVHFAQPS